MLRWVWPLALALTGCTDAPNGGGSDALRMTDASGAVIALDDFSGDVIGMELVWLH